MANEFLKNFLLYGLGAFTIYLVEQYDRGIAWMYMFALFLGIALYKPESVTSLTNFFENVTKGTT